MKFQTLPFRSRFPAPITCRWSVLVVMVAALASLMQPRPALAQVRGKLPDRGVYQPPTVSPRLPTARESAARPATIVEAQPLRDPAPESDRFAEAELDEAPRLIRPASHVIGLNEPYVDAPVHFADPAMSYGGCDSCGGGGCDSCSGCDSYGCGDLVCRPLFGPPERWFGRLELLLMFRKGDFLRPLVTTDPASEGATAGTLPGARVLAGGEKVFDEMTAGGRWTIGTWLDSCQNRSLVGRFWTGTETDYSFSASQVDFPVLAIPFFNVDANAQATNLIAFPAGTENLGRFGAVNVSGKSNVYGGDLSVRQFWTGGLGTTYDVFYGYQYMRLDESLSLSTNSTLSQTTSPTAQAGFTTAITDAYETTNEFHGGQLGLAGQFREGCWSFDFLAKVAFGQLRREAELAGQTITSNGTPPVAVQDDGLFVRSSNEGTFSDNTFGWVPELNVDLGWHYFPRFDVTIGYHLIAMTDALQLSSLLDNATNDATGVRPALNPQFDDFFVHGLTFGIRHAF